MKIMLIGTYNFGLGIHKELKIIKEIIKPQQTYSISTEYATSSEDFSELIQNGKYDLIHISSHANLDGKIKLPNIDLIDSTNTNIDKHTKLLKPKELAEFLKNADVKCVVLNFCYSEQVVQLIYKDVQYVIGIKGAIGGGAALEFSQAFYSSLVTLPLSPSNVDQAFAKGKAAAFPKSENLAEYIKHNKPFKFIALKAHNGKYVSAKDHSGSEVVANGDKIDKWEIFERIELEGSKVALKAHNGQYVSAELGPDSDSKIVANRNPIEKWEIFERIELEDGKVALKADNGKFVCADKNKDYRLIANRADIQGWEKFFMEDVFPI
jgi:hypothetical protein